MPVEEDFDEGNDVTVTQNFIGARGIEAMTVDSGSGAVTRYPLYDTHGNMIATVRSLSSGTAWDIADERNYDVWGSVRQGATTGGPKGRYCANLGHVQDDESGLVYMRARYYEPETGRFLSEDSKGDGHNWYLYTSNNPTNKADWNGNESEDFDARALKQFRVGFFFWIAGMLANCIPDNTPYMKTLKILISSTLQAIGAIQMCSSALKADAKYGPSTGTALAIGVTSLATAVLCSIAVYQINLMYLMMDDEPDYTGKKPSEYAMEQGYPIFGM